MKFIDIIMNPTGFRAVYLLEDGSKFSAPLIVREDGSLALNLEEAKPED